MIYESDPRIPNTSTVCQLWHRDTLDRDSSPSLQGNHTNIIHGLYELWLYTLKEGILDNGSASFSRFYLTWGDSAATRADVIENPFDNLALLKLRLWAGFAPQPQNSENGKDAILWRLAQLHYELLRKSTRWNASAVDWCAEARELLAHVEFISDPEEL